MQFRGLMQNGAGASEAAMMAEMGSRVRAKAARPGTDLADATEGLSILRDTGQAASAPDFLAFLALHAAVQGREDECRAHAEGALERATALGLGLPAAEASHALALLDLGLGRPAEAFERLHALAGAAPGAGHPLWGFKNCVSPANPDFSRRELSFDTPQASTLSQWSLTASATRSSRIRNSM